MVNTDSLSALVTAIKAMLFTGDKVGLQLTHNFDPVFANSIYIICIVTLGYGLLRLLRPVLSRSQFSEQERKRATSIVVQHGRSSLARLALLDDKSYYFSPSGQSVIAYGREGRGAISLGDPIGPAEDCQEAIVGFQQFCTHNDWYPAFYQTLPNNLKIYESLGLQVLQIGEEAIVDLKTFTLEGKAGKDLRSMSNKFTRLGYTVQFHQPPSNELLADLKSISDEWLQTMHGSEKKFSSGWFDDRYLKNSEIAAVHTANGQIVAFVNIVSEYQQNDITLDLMRHRAQVEHGTMDFLFICLFQQFKERGYDGLNLGLSALSGVGEVEPSPRLEKGIHYLYEHMNRFYNFQGLHSYKNKFHPRWEPRYLIYPNLTALPDVVVALVRADSGDRLFDYFKPGN